MPYDPAFCEQIQISQACLGGQQYLVAIHRQHGRVGQISFELDEAYVRVGFLSVRWRRRGVASLLMRELETRYEGMTLDHGERSDLGRAWAEGFYGHQERYTVAATTEPVGVAA